MILKKYQVLGGVHPETASIKNVYAYHGVKSPHNGKPLSEAMILGIAGGLGATYMLWEFEKHGYPSLVLAFQNKANYPIKFIENFSQRTGATTKILETAGVKKAATQLEETLAAGHPAIAWMDLGGKPYYEHFLSLGVNVIYGLDGDDVYVDRFADKPFILTAELVGEARAKVPSFKNRIMIVEPSGKFNLEAAIQAGLEDQIDYLNASSTSFSLPSLRKWARMLTDEKNDKGWPTVFKGGRGLYGSLRTVYIGIEHAGTGGGGMRGLYAEFLDEAAGILGNESLKDVAVKYRDLHKQWHTLAQAALPDSIAVFKKTKALVDQRYSTLQKHGSEGLEAISPINDELHEIKGELNDSFPMDQAGMNSLFNELQNQVMEIFEAEKEALKALKASVN